MQPWYKLEDEVRELRSTIRDSGLVGQVLSRFDSDVLGSSRKLLEQVANLATEWLARAEATNREVGGQLREIRAEIVELKGSVEVLVADTKTQALRDQKSVVDFAELKRALEILWQQTQQQGARQQPVDGVISSPGGVPRRSPEEQVGRPVTSGKPSGSQADLVIQRGERTSITGKIMLDDTEVEVMIELKPEHGGQARSRQHWTGRQLQIYSLLGRGETNEAIAKKLGMTQTEIETEIGVLMEKLKVSTRAQIYAEGTDVSTP